MKPYYDHKGITIYHGDCLEILPQLDPVDLVLTDPPYGVGRDKGFEGFEGFEGFGGFGEPIARRRFEDEDWDKKRPSDAHIDATVKAGKLSIIWGGNYFADVLPRSTHWIFWDKCQTMPTFGDGELAWTNSKRKSVTKIVIEWNGLLGKESVRFGPTQKPLSLMLWCIEMYRPHETIIDPFMGTGTTLLAAKKSHKRAIGIDKSLKWCEIAVRRLAQEMLPFGSNQSLEGTQKAAPLS